MGLALIWGDLCPVLDVLCMRSSLVPIPHSFLCVCVCSIQFTHMSKKQQKGRIAEEGTHAQLKTQNGVYAHLLKTYKEGIIDA